MEQYVTWDGAADATHMSQSPTHEFDSTFADMATDLVFENICQDGFSFHALQHFTQGHTTTSTFGNDISVPHGLQLHAPPPVEAISHSDFWETPIIPCAQCSVSGHLCKRIREGRYKGFCTSCVALEATCSFGDAVPENTSPSTTGLSPNRRFSLDGIVGQDTTEFSVVNNIESSSVPDLTGTNHGFQTPNLVAPIPNAAPAKVGARFSRESVRILKTWLTTHNRHPYPSEEEKELLQRKTGLNKTQITNWLANARRRGKVQAPRATSPQPWAGLTSSSVDIPQRRGTPALEAMNPLQRWEHSPPENEPASASAIARAVTASSANSSGLNSPYSHPYTDDGSGRSLCNQSSVSSLGTSQSSNGSMGSAYSHGSRNSWGSFGSAPFNNHSRRRRRRRTAPATGTKGKTELTAPLKTFQCTFCTETFRTKHDWQRHEKSLHLSLERWVCAPHGVSAVNPDTGAASCVFCGLANPDDEHIESHNHSTCKERIIGERTFYRKDHLNQHLRLVHGAKFVDWSMKSWKVSSPEIRSRCGFCNLVMDSWTIRVDHLAEHFKTGYSMADWKGDWGFDAPVLDMVENSIPPYLIDYERSAPLPYVASSSPPESPRNAYELIKLEMAFYIANHVEQHGREPTDDEMIVEGCRVIFASELLSLKGIAAEDSWLRDLIMKLEDPAKKARFGRLRAGTENRLASLKIKGKDNLFELCPMEFQLHEFVRAKRLLGLTAMDYELQEEACRIVGRVEEVSPHPSDTVANWLLRLITCSSDWLAAFRRRAHLPRSEDVQDEITRSKDPRNIDSTIHSYTRLESELGAFLKAQRLLGIEPTDDDLQRHARIIIYEFDDGWNQTAADNITWLAAFKDRHQPPQSSSSSAYSPNQKLTPSLISHTPTTTTATATTTTTAMFDDSGAFNTAGPYVLNDTNCYRRLGKELGRWVAATMSAKNPNRHVPTDEELQHQARWLLYEDGDMWNRTPADNADWLQEFKTKYGILAEVEQGIQLAYTVSSNSTLDHHQQQQQQQQQQFLSIVPTDMSLDDVSQESIDNILQDMDFDMAVHGGLEQNGGVSLL